MTVLDFSPTYSAPTYTSPERIHGVHAGIVPVQLHDELWRITRPDGDVLGYVERRSTASGYRYTAKRLLQRQRRFLPVGDFWVFDDAIDCFRF